MYSAFRRLRRVCVHAVRVIEAACAASALVARPFRTQKEGRRNVGIQLSKTLDGIIADCKEQNIEVLPPAEIERMKKMWGEYEKHNSDRA